MQTGRLFRTEDDIGLLKAGVAHRPFRRQRAAAACTLAGTMVLGMGDDELLRPSVTGRALLPPGRPGRCGGRLLLRRGLFRCGSIRGPIVRRGRTPLALWRRNIGPRPRVPRAGRTRAIVGILVESLARLLEGFDHPDQQRLDRLRLLHHQTVDARGIELTEVVVADLHTGGW